MNSLTDTCKNSMEPNVKETRSVKTRRSSNAAHYNPIVLFEEPDSGDTVALIGGSFRFNETAKQNKIIKGLTDLGFQLMQSMDDCLEYYKEQNENWAQLQYGAFVSFENRDIYIEPIYLFEPVERY